MERYEVKLLSSNSFCFSGIEGLTICSSRMVPLTRILHSCTRTACLYVLCTMYHVSKYGVNELA
jgi:hypothetical protein